MIRQVVILISPVCPRFWLKKLRIRRVIRSRCSLRRNRHETLAHFSLFWSSLLLPHYLFLGSISIHLIYLSNFPGTSHRRWATIDEKRDRFIVTYIFHFMFSAGPSSKNANFYGGKGNGREGIKEKIEWSKNERRGYPHLRL